MIFKWFKRLISGQPHFRIGGENAYMLRWYLLPRNPWFNIYLHKFLRDDDDRALHDHPWNFCSLMIKGAYRETRPNGVTTRIAPSFAYRRATDQHRVALDRDENNKEIPCWTIVLTGAKIRNWGFWCLKGFVPWQDFVDHSDKGNIGKGCGE